jgi:replicative DNA helicase
MEDEVNMIAGMLCNARRTSNLILSAKTQWLQYEPHVLILNAMKEMVNKYETFSLVSIISEYPAVEDINLAYERGVGLGVKPDDVAVFYSKVQQGYIRRQSIEAIRKANIELAEGSINCLPKLVQTLSLDLIKPELEEDPVVSLLEGIRRRQGTDTIVEGFTTDYHLLDMAINGICKDQLTIIAARARVGKTTFLLNICKKLAENKKVVLFSYEMSKKQIVKRLFYMMGITRDYFMSNNLSEDQQASLKRVAQQVTQVLKNLIIDSTKPTYSTMRAKVSSYKSDGVEIFAFDYLQKVPKEDVKASDCQHVEQVSGLIKSLTTDLNIACISLAQLNREGSKRVHKSPILEDLRGSGAIEQDADNVLLLDRPALNKPDDHNYRYTEVHVAKVRDGEPDLVFEFDFNMPHQTFTEIKEVEHDNNTTNNSGEDAAKPIYSYSKPGRRGLGPSFGPGLKD